MNILTPFIDRFVLRRVRPHALSVFGERFGGIIAHQLLWWSEGDFEEITSRSIRHRAAGTRLILSFAAMSAAMHRTLVASNVAPAEAEHLVAEIGRRTYAPLWRIPWRLACFFAFGRESRLAMTVRLFRLFPFGTEDYDMRERSFGDGRVCLDILRCPTIALCEDLGIPHLCRASAISISGWRTNGTRRSSGRSRSPKATTGATSAGRRLPRKVRHDGSARRD
jgi:hypothetical protein